MRLCYAAFVGVLLSTGCGGPGNPAECGEETECAGGEICIDSSCYRVCSSSRDCPPANEACLSQVCREFSAACSVNAPDECPEGWFCNGSGACQKSPVVINCINGVQDGEETDIDCGGADCDPCGEGKGCATGDDCGSLVCGVSNTCLAPSCSDDAQNGGETDVDCGGATSCDRCADGRVCAGDNDCASQVCGLGAACAVPTCLDGVKNGGETDVDCGGATSCDRCADEQTCTEAADCVSRVCGSSATCVAPSCADGVQNGGESDADCGGATTCDRCATDRSCTQGGDCVSGSCQDDECREPTCDDTVRNGEETDVDCGGGTCAACAAGDGCAVDTDCQSHACGQDDTCLFGQGEQCSGDGSACTTGHCVDGFCCDSPCDGVCVSCAGDDTGGANGSCEQVAGTWLDVPCDTGTTIAGFCANKHVLQLRRCDDTLYTPDASYVSYHLCGCNHSSCGCEEGVTWKSVRCCFE